MVVVRATRVVVVRATRVVVVRARFDCRVVCQLVPEVTPTRAAVSFVWAVKRLCRAESRVCGVCVPHSSGVAPHLQKRSSEPAYLR